MTDDDGVPGSGAGKAPLGPLPDLDTRIERAREAAEQRRRELGLPDLPPDEVDVPAGRKPGKRGKDHRGFQGAARAD
jgi:hypothetical protein